MVGMLQIMTYMFAFYLVLKGIEILQIGVASARQSRTGMIIAGAIILAACMVAAVAFVLMQDNMATHISSGMSGLNN